MITLASLSSINANTRAMTEVSKDLPERGGVDRT